MFSESAQAAYLQVLSLGLIWTLGHCIPMCGPIIAGLNLGKNLGGSAFGALLFYQLGRGVMYVLFGAFTGYLAASFFEDKSWLGWLVVGFLGVLLLQKILADRLNMKAPPFLIKWLGKLSQLNFGRFRPFFLGLIMSFLPCMLVFWALGLAAQTASAWAGAVVMLLLVLITSLPLALVIVGGNFIHRFRFAFLDKIALVVSIIWCSLMTAAAQGLIGHQQIALKIFGKDLMLMLW